MTNARLLHRRVASAFYGKFPQLRDLQEASIGPLIGGRNLVLCAGTGSGKTEAVVAPLVSRSWAEFHKAVSPLIVYIAPTRALVNDLEKRLHRPVSDLGLRLGMRHSDRDDMRKKKKPHILITTPESLDVMICRDENSLGAVRAVIADEVHLFYNTQRGLHLAILLQRLQHVLQGLPLQVAALSATIGQLKDIAAFFLLPEADTDFLQFSTSRKIEAQVRGPDLRQILPKLKSDHGLKLLAFVDRRKDCDEIAATLDETHAFPGPILVHYSSLSRDKRVQTERQFAKAINALCVATSTLELGIDIGDIDAVLLCSVPPTLESFLQRIGRGNRRTEVTHAVCFAGMSEDRQVDVDDNEMQENESIVIQALRYITLIESAIKGELPRQAPYELYGAVAQQCLSVMHQRGGKFTRLADLAALFSGFPYLSRDTLERILDELVRKGCLKRHPIQNRYAADEILYDLIDQRRVYGNFPSAARMIEIRYGSLVLGEIPEFNVQNMMQGDLIAFAGRKWNVSLITTEYVQVEPASEGEPKSVKYVGGREAHGTYVTDRVWHTIHADDFPDHLVAADLRESISAARYRAKAISDVDSIPWSQIGESFCYYTFAGPMVNRAVALFTQQARYSVGDHRVTVVAPIDWQSLPSDPKAYLTVLIEDFRQSGDQTIFQKMLPVDLQAQELLELWLKDQSIAKVLLRLSHSVPVQVSANEWPFA